MAEPVLAMIEAPVPLTILPVKVATSVMKMPMSPVMVPPGLMPLTEAKLTMLPVNDDTPANGSGSETPSSYRLAGADGYAVAARRNDTAIGDAAVEGGDIDVAVKNFGGRWRR